MCTEWVPKLWMLSEKVRIFDKKVTEIRVSEIRVSEIKVSEIRVSEIRVSEIRVTKISDRNQNFLKSPRAPWSYFCYVHSPPSPPLPCLLYQGKAESPITRSLTNAPPWIVFSWEPPKPKGIKTDRLEYLRYEDHVQSGQYCVSTLPNKETINLLDHAEWNFRHKLNLSHCMKFVNVKISQMRQLVATRQ